MVGVLISCLLLDLLVKQSSGMVNGDLKKKICTIQLYLKFKFKLQTSYRNVF